VVIRYIIIWCATPNLKIQRQIPRDGYRVITSLSNDLVKEWAMSKEKLVINNEMQERIPISIIKLDNHSFETLMKDVPTITDPEVI
jgi:hypothetical protein